MGTDDVSIVATAALRILKEDYNDELTERIIRKRISEETGIDTEVLEMRSAVGDAVKGFLEKRGAEPTADGTAEGESDEVENAPEDKVEGDVAKSREDAPESKIKGDVAKAGERKRLKDNEAEVVCELSTKRRLAVSRYGGNVLVSIREYYEKNGDMLPGKKGISLTIDQWKVLVDNIATIKDAIIVSS